MHSESFTLTMPAGWSGGVVFASPHSGTHYPLDLAQATTLDNLTLRSSEDAFVDQLFAAAPKLGAPLLAATYPRAYVDLNRGPDELDPALIEGVSKRAVNPRVASGLGVIPRVVANGRPISRGKLKRSDAATRLVQIWHPYHDQLTALMSQARLQAGQALLIDCHSMPHEAIETATRAGTRPDVVLGDRYGAAARGDLVDRDRVGDTDVEGGLDSLHPIQRRHHPDDALPLGRCQTPACQPHQRRTVPHHPRLSNGDDASGR